MEVNIIRIKGSLNWADRHSVLNQVDRTKVNIVVNAAGDLTAFKEANNVGEAQIELGTLYSGSEMSFPVHT